VNSRRRPSITPEERERLRLEARKLSRLRCAQAAAAKTVEAQAWLAAQGLLVEGEGVGTGLVRLDRWRRALGYGVGGVQTSAPAYRPTFRQQQAALLPGMDEVEF